MLLVYVLIFLILYLYFKYYFKYSTKFEIIQANVSKVTPELLFEKSPIIINERVVNPEDLAKTTFKYLYMKKLVKVDESNQLKKCRGKYNVISPMENDIILDVYHPVFKEKQQVKLYHNQCIILPFHWKYQVIDKHSRVMVMELLDVFSILKN
jgi:hypothetical protein